LINFAGFQNFIDELGGVTIDVPARLVDREFPDSNMK
jgi:anionic cell wall polymer biosynthesis LytR-Cps2A-Psr (LCP) family protein